MKKTLIIIAILFSVVVFSQETVNEIIYKKKAGKLYVKDSTELSPKVLAIFNAGEAAMKKKSYKLSFDDKHSYFEEIPSISNTTDTKESFEVHFGNKLADKTGNIMGIFYTDVSKDIFIKQKNANFDLYLITTKLSKRVWDIDMKSSKKVGNYTCYKATTVQNAYNNGVNLARPVTAWFSPELAYPFGPGDYAGLPGLILELVFESQKVVVYADKITLNKAKTKKDKGIKPPKKGIKVSEEAYNTMLKNIKRAKG